MARPRLARYELIEEFLSKNIGFAASPAKLRNALECNITIQAMSHYIRYMKIKGELVEIRGRYYLSHQIPKKLEVYL